MGNKNPQEKILEESILVPVYNMRTKKRYSQAFKRKNLVKKKVIFTNEQGNREAGVCIGFTDSGGLLVYHRAGSMPVDSSEVLFILGA